MHLQFYFQLTPWVTMGSPGFSSDFETELGWLKDGFGSPVGASGYEEYTGGKKETVKYCVDRFQLYRWGASAFTVLSQTSCYWLCNCLTHFPALWLVRLSVTALWTWPSKMRCPVQCAKLPSALTVLQLLSRNSYQTANSWQLSCNWVEIQTRRNCKGWL